MKTTGFGLDRRKGVSLALIPVYLALIAIFFVLNLGTSFNPPILLLLFNSIFLGLIPLYGAFIAYRSFRGSGSTGVMMQGIGLLMIGFGAIAAGAVNYLPNSMNANVTIQNTSFCAGAFLQLVGVLIALAGIAPRQKPGNTSKITLAYIGSAFVFIVFAVATVRGAVPPFFIQGIGFTALRELIIISAIEFFILSGGILFWLYYRKREEYFFWYSIGLALIGLGLIAVHFPSVLGSPLGWVGRSAQYLGGLYILIAFVALNRSARRTGIPIENILARFFSEAEAGYKSLIETATDAIVVFDANDRVLVWNQAAETMIGYSESEAIGSSFTHLALPDESAGIIKNNFRSHGIPGAGSPVQKPVEITIRRKDGSTFPAEVTLSRRVVGGTEVSTCIIRDLTERKRSEKALQENESILQSFFNVQGAMRGIVEVIADDDVLHLMDNVITAGFIDSTPEKLKNRLGSEIGEPRDILRIWVSHYRESQRSGSPVSFEYMDKRGDHEVWLQATVSYLGMPPGGCPRFAYVVTDITGRKVAEEKLRYHANLVETISDAVISTDAGLTILSWNKAAETVYGWRPDEVLGKKGSEILMTEFPEGTDRESITRDMFEKGIWHGELIQRTKAGNVITVEATSMRLNDETGRIIGAVSVSRNITERKRAEDALRESEEKFRVLTQNLQSAVALIDEHGAFSVVNASFLRMFGIPADTDILNVNSQDWARWDVLNEDCTPLDVEQHPVRKAALTGRAVKNQLVAMKSPSGPDLKWLLISAEPILDTHGGIHRIICTYYDITDSKNAEAEKSNLAAIVESSDDAIIGKSLDGTISSWNAGAGKIYGYSGAEVIGRNISILVPRGVANDLEFVMSKIKHGESFTHYETQRMKKDGTVFPVSLTMSPIRDNAGKLVGASTIARDISERRKTEDELKRKHEDLNAAYEEITLTQEELRQNVEELSTREHQLTDALAEKEVLLAEIHHRVKNNLTAFISLLSLEGSTEETPAGRELKKDLQNRARSMALIHETLYRTHQFSSVDMDAYLTPLIDQIAKSYSTSEPVRIIVEAKGVALDIARATPLGLIINELVTNSLKHAFPPGIECRENKEDPCTIGVRLTEENGSYLLKVYDNGIGVPAGFDPLTAKSLGLKLVNFLAKHQLGAGIEINTGKGTEFVFHLNKNERYP